MANIEQAKVANIMDRAVLPRKDFALVLLGAGILGAAIFAGEYLTMPPILTALLAFVRLALGLAYVLYVPGYCLTAALFPRTEDLDGIERNIRGKRIRNMVAARPVVARAAGARPADLRAVRGGAAGCRAGGGVDLPRPVARRVHDRILHPRPRGFG